MSLIATLLGIFGLGTGAGWFIIRNLYYICQPSEILIFAGTKTKDQEGKEVGYRLVKGGSSIRTPLLEQAFRMDLTNMIIELKVVMRSKDCWEKAVSKSNYWQNKPWREICGES